MDFVMQFIIWTKNENVRNTYGDDLTGFTRIIIEVGQLKARVKMLS